MKAIQFGKGFKEFKSDTNTFKFLFYSMFTVLWLHTTGHFTMTSDKSSLQLLYQHILSNSSV